MSIIRSAAGELPNVSLLYALAICVVIRKRQPYAFERAAVRRLGRFASECPHLRLDAVVESGGGATAGAGSAEVAEVSALLLDPQWLDE